MVLCALLASAARAGEPDAAGCKDHPLVTRLSGYRIYSCKAAEFEAAQFYADARNNQATVEGRLAEVQYSLEEGRTPPSPLQIARNYEAALSKIGGKVVSSFEDGGGQIATVRLARDGKEYWVEVMSYNPEQYKVRVLEKGGMAQEVVADAAALRAGLAAAGHVEVPGILFDTGKSTLKPESDRALGELARLLAADPGLRAYVVGHTDNAGALPSNLTLSGARADAVVKALVSRFKVDPRRLAPFGAGPYAPVASNATDDGKARNRRVELVTQ
jgi:outer membrane protein OmpA-like peptidoglycan-associated protein